MSKKLLNQCVADPVFQKMTCKRVAQGMGCHTIREAQLFYLGLHELLYG